MNFKPTNKPFNARQREIELAALSFCDVGPMSPEQGGEDLLADGVLLAADHELAGKQPVEGALAAIGKPDPTRQLSVAQPRPGNGATQRHSCRVVGPEGGAGSADVG
jgi:hypothetical protein